MVKDIIGGIRMSCRMASKAKSVLIIEDITEFERMKERLERDERLRAMGEMAARIAHEIKILVSMVLFLSMLHDAKMRVKDRQYVEYIRFVFRLFTDNQQYPVIHKAKDPCA